MMLLGLIVRIGKSVQIKKSFTVNNVSILEKTGRVYILKNKLKGQLYMTKHRGPNCLKVYQQTTKVTISSQSIHPYKASGHLVCYLLVTLANSFHSDRPG